MLESDITLFVSRKHCNYMTFLLVSTFRQVSDTASDQLVEDVKPHTEKNKGVLLQLLSNIFDGHYNLTINIYS